MRTHYTLVDDWYIEGDIVEVADVLGDAPDFARWWSTVYEDVTVVDPGDEYGVGKVIDIHATGWPRHPDESYTYGRCDPEWTVPSPGRRRGFSVPMDRRSFRP